ncbi:hypothetical protein [Paenibacillus rigui]|uniref:Uncharacterized protein n=1 Tax=Paenibacillus rigui TaxID=554312 RepID=A0A229UKZ9_9BACL|nr:hypothetical protein [Paenibacillus rigui]OXM84080.1 hypothetical protein CF651_21790 [Paenibacillus rigui]
MKKLVLRLSTLLLWTSLLTASPLSTAAIQEHPPQPAPIVKPDSPERLKTMTTPTFMDAVNQWVGRIAKEKGYEAWSSAAWTSYPLGPGTHGWIVLLQAGGREVGYLVIHAADPNQPNTYQLSEYGSGSNPLFSMNTLYQSLVQLELIDTSYEAERWYIDPMHALWIVTTEDHTYFIDASSGEVLPLTSRQQLLDAEQASSADIISPSTVTPRNDISTNRQIDGFDPYDNMTWLLQQPLPSMAFAGLQALLDTPVPARLTFIAELYGGQVNIPFAVTGYQQWSNEDGYLQLEHNGHRAIPYRYAAAAGKLFHQQDTPPVF